MNEQDIPIDIHSSKLLEWLVSRRHVGKDWQKNVTPVREKINNAIQDMPAHEEIVKLLTGQHINYFHCLKIIEILKETEADTKNMFGRYGSQRMKDWQDILSCYEKDNLYLAETSQILVRNIKYEIPSIRKQIVKYEQSVLDCEKKIKDLAKSENTTAKEFKSECDQLGITGKNIKTELLELIKDLPNVYEGVAKDVANIDDVVDLYEAFYEYLSGNKENLVKTLKYVAENGNVTTYEYLNGTKPVKIEIAKSKTSSEGTETSNEIDFGDIDFGNQSSDDWSVKTEEEFEIIEHQDLAKDGTARGVEALTVLDNPETRSSVINDLLELSAFLKMRVYEMSDEGNVISMSQLQEAPPIVQRQTSETISGMRERVLKAIDGLTNKRIQYLHNIKHSSNFIDTITANLNQKLLLIDRVRANTVLLEKKIEEINREANGLRETVEVLVTKTRELQRDIEAEISKKYNGRVVNIVGGVNIL